MSWVLRVPNLQIDTYLYKSLLFINQNSIENLVLLSLISCHKLKAFPAFMNVWVLTWWPQLGNKGRIVKPCLLGCWGRVSPLPGTKLVILTVDATDWELCTWYFTNNLRHFFLCGSNPHKQSFEADFIIPISDKEAVVWRHCISTWWRAQTRSFWLHSPDLWPLSYTISH